MFAELRHENSGSRVPDSTQSLSPSKRRVLQRETMNTLLDKAATDRQMMSKFINRTNTILESDDFFYPFLFGMQKTLTESAPDPP